MSIRNWSEIIDKTSKIKNVNIKPDKNFRNHHIPPCSMISVIGPTGSGKSNFLLEFLHLKNDSFYEITVFIGSTADEKLYNYLKEQLPDINFIDDVTQLPNLDDYKEEDKSIEKLMVFDDIINLKKKELIEIQKWFNSSRKYGFTVIAMAQNYPDLPIQIRRNTMIWIIFKLRDANTVKHILKNHNTNGDDPDIVEKAYQYATENKGQFFKINLLVSGIERYSKNFIHWLPVSKNTTKR